jgi:hypothetical protein
MLAVLLAGGWVLFARLAGLQEGSSAGASRFRAGTFRNGVAACCLVDPGQERTRL